MLALDRSRVEFTSVLEFGLAFITLAGLLRSPVAVALAVGVRALDELLLDPRLVLAVIVGDVEPAWKSTSGLGDVASMAWGA